MSTSTTIAIKVQLFDASGNKTAHRFRGVFDYDELMATINRLGHNVDGMAPSRLALTYRDPDGDDVSLQSPLEWKECQLLHEESGDKTLNLVARPAGVAASATKVQPSPQPQPQHISTPAPVMVAPVVAVVEVPQHVANDVEIQEEPDAIRLANLMQCGSVPPLQDVITAACAAMDKRAYTTAECVLEAALGTFPKNKIILYNMACVCSLQDAKDRALHFLEQAVVAGYNNVSHLQNDEDLKNIRNDERFHALLVSLGCAVELPPQANASAASAVSPATPRDVRTLLDMFPGLDKLNAQGVLDMCRGDVDAAVAKLLE